MRTLLLLRHAKSSWKDPTVHDHDRPLNRRGRQAARTMGEFMKARGLVPDLILTSSAVRAQETVQRVCRHSDYQGAVRPLPGLYLAEPAAVLAHLHGLGDGRLAQEGRRGEEEKGGGQQHFAQR